jgi:MtN3 and saliva related transmembrane protein
MSPDLLGAAATGYGVAAAVAVLLQAHQLLRSRRSCEVSARFFASYVGGYLVWLLYGVSIGSMPLILVDLVGLVCGGFTLGLTLALRGSLLDPRSWASACPG